MDAHYPLGLLLLSPPPFSQDDLHVEPAEVALLTGLSSLPWMIKPLCESAPYGSTHSAPQLLYVNSRCYGSIQTPDPNPCVHSHPFDAFWLVPPPLTQPPTAPCCSGIMPPSLADGFVSDSPPLVTHGNLAPLYHPPTNCALLLLIVMPPSQMASSVTVSPCLATAGAPTWLRPDCWAPPPGPCWPPGWTRRTALWGPCSLPHSPRRSATSLSTRSWWSGQGGHHRWACFLGLPRAGGHEGEEEGLCLSFRALSTPYPPPFPSLAGYFRVAAVPVLGLSGCRRHRIGLLLREPSGGLRDQVLREGVRGKLVGEEIHNGVQTDDDMLNMLEIVAPTAHQLCPALLTQLLSLLTPRATALYALAQVCLFDHGAVPAHCLAVGAAD